MNDVFFRIFEVFVWFFIALNIILLSNAYASSWYLKRTRRFSFREVKEAFKMGGLSTAVLNSV